MIESPALEKCSVHVVDYSIDYALLQIAEPKTRYRCARHQIARLATPPGDRSGICAPGTGSKTMAGFRPDDQRRFQKLLKANSLLELPEGISKGADMGSLRAGGASWLLMASENSELTRRRGRWISMRRRRGRSSSSHASHRKSRWRFFRRGLQLARRWRRAAIPDSAWPVLFEEAARDFELKSLRGNRWVLEKPQTRHCAPTSLAREKKPARAEELLSNSECHVAGSKPCPQATRPRASSNRS